jgi:hypothetical protein
MSDASARWAIPLGPSDVDYERTFSYYLDYYSSRNGPTLG